MCTVVIAVKLICRFLWTTRQSNVDPSYPDSHLRDTLSESESCSHMCDWHAQRVEIGKVGLTVFPHAAPDQGTAVSLKFRRMPTGRI